MPPRRTTAATPRTGKANHSAFRAIVRQWIAQV